MTDPTQAPRKPSRWQRLKQAAIDFLLRKVGERIMREVERRGYK